MGDLVIARNCCMDRMLPGEASSSAVYCIHSWLKPSWCRNEQVCQGGGGKKCKAL